jgi:hypothetical protein
MTNAFNGRADVLVYVAFLLIPCIAAFFLRRLAQHAASARGKKVRGVTLRANLLVFVLLASLAVAGGETYYRFFCDTTDSFGLTRITLRWFYRHWHLNEAGFRDSVAQYPPERPRGKRRVTFLGDSFTAGHGVQDVEDRFANIIRRKSDYDVHVLANIGFDTGEELRLVEQLIQQNYQFDEVVLVYILNDISDIAPEKKAFDDRIASVSSSNFFVEHSFVINTWYYRFKASSDPDIANYYRFVLANYDGPVWATQQERLKTLRSLIESHGGHFTVVTFPFLHQLGPAYEYRPVHARLQGFWKDQGVPALDLLQLYETHRSENLTVGRHDAHPNAHAHALAADAILEFLKKNSKPADASR